MCLWYIVESEHAPAEFEEKVCAEGDNGPERKLETPKKLAVRTCIKGNGAEAYDGDDLVLY